MIESGSDRRSGTKAGGPGNVLVTSAARKIPLLQRVKQAAARINPEIQLVAGDSDDGALARYFCDVFWHMPKLKDLTAASLIRACREYGVTSIIPTRDGELAYFAHNRDALARAGIAVMVSQADAIDLCLDKVAFSSFCGGKDLPAVPTYAMPSEEVSFSWVVKERHGSGSRGIGIGLPPDEAVAHARKLDAPVFQPFIPHVMEVSIDAYVDHGATPRGCVIRSRDVVENGESQITTTQDMPELLRICQAFLSTLPLYGHVVIQALVEDLDGKARLLECNPRFGGASSLSVEAGLDSFYWFLLEAAGADLSRYPCRYDPKRRLRLVRHVTDLIIPID